jgi:hypothetical protein
MKPIMSPWFNFFEMAGGAAATLLGLLFVSASVNAKAILSDAHRSSRRLAEQAFQNYLVILIVSLGAMLPRPALWGFGDFILGTSAIWAVWVVIRMVEALREGARSGSPFKLARRYTASVIGFGMLVYSGADISFAHKDMLDYTAVGILVLLISATIVSWELLLSIAGATGAD